jgi:hypothetical protein
MRNDLPECAMIRAGATIEVTIDAGNVDGALSGYQFGS